MPSCEHWVQGQSHKQDSHRPCPQRTYSPKGEIVINNMCWHGLWEEGQGTRHWAVLGAVGWGGGLGGVGGQGMKQKLAT